MKTVRILLIATCLGTGLIRGEEKTLFSSGETRHGGFGGPWVKFSPANGEFGVWVGGRGAWLINSVLSIGGGMYGLSNGVKADVPDTANLMVGVAGFILEAVVFPDRIAHGIFSMLIGTGGVVAGRNMGMGRNDGRNGGHMFVLEPELNLEINVTRFFRFCPGVSYRWMAGDPEAVASAWNVSAPSANLMFKFGRF